jgi:hypothetical protein
MVLGTLIPELDESGWGAGYLENGLTQTKTPAFTGALYLLFALISANLRQKFA